MAFNRLFDSPEDYYSVGIDTETGEYLLEVVITWVAWYSLFFRLTPEEVAAFEKDKHALTPLSYAMASDKGTVKFRDRLVSNEGPQRRSSP